MSSFNINGPSNNQPMVQSSQNLGKDGGGGGSTGYMNMRKRKGSNNNNEDDNSVFLEETPEDSFVKEGEQKEKKPKKKFLGAISRFIKGKVEPNNTERDSFVKTNQDETLNADEIAEENYENYKPYEIPVNKQNDILDDDEYEIAEDDDYYGGIDV